MDLQPYTDVNVNNHPMVFVVIRTADGALHGRLDWQKIEPHRWGLQTFEKIDDEITEHDNFWTETKSVFSPVDETIHIYPEYDDFEILTSGKLRFKGSDYDWGTDNSPVWDLYTFRQINNEVIKFKYNETHDLVGVDCKGLEIYAYLDGRWLTKIGRLFMMGVWSTISMTDRNLDILESVRNEMKGTI